jgi:hypothetical protein
MVIHDFRTPANQIEYAMNIALEQLAEMDKIISDVHQINFENLKNLGFNLEEKL